MKNECAIVNDLLPLYQENMVAPETADFVRQHLSECAECTQKWKQQAEIMRDTATENNEHNADAIHQISRKLKRKKRVAIISTAFLIVAMIVVVNILVLPITDFGESVLYTEAEQTSAVLAIQKNMRATFGFSYLTALRYAGDGECRELHNEYAENPELEDIPRIIKFYGNLVTPFSDPSMEIYTSGWSWILVQDYDGNWKVINQGFC